MSPRADEMDDLPKAVALDAPRPLAAGERALLEALVRPLGLAALDEQVAHAEVWAGCSCGCPSVSLRGAGPALPTDEMKRLSDLDRGKSALVQAWGRNDEGRIVEVALHLRDGRLEELEIWAGWDGGEVRTALPAVRTLRPEPTD